MRKIFAIILCLPLAGTMVYAHLADVPIELREENYDGPRSQGSCAYASVATAMRWVGLHDIAAWWVITYGDGATVWDITEKLDTLQIPYALTMTGDIEFLEWATRNRFPAVMFHMPIGHCVNMVNMTDTEVWILDNNTPDVYTIFPRAETIARWQRLGPGEADLNSSGWALVIMGTPAPPWPAQEPWK